MKNVTRRALVCLMSVGLVAAFAGTISGSIAWYAYSTRVTTTYSGTSVAEAVQLQIGLVSNVDFTVDDEGHDLGFNLTYEDVPDTDYDYYWAKAGSGFSSDAILAFLTKQGIYATNELHPVTTRTFAGLSTSEFHLYKAPLAGHALMTQDAAAKSYSHIPFVFRIYDANSNLVKGADIWLTDSTVAASGASENIREAVRLYFSEGPNEFVLNPSSELTTKGSTKVAGPLDLNVDGVYDYADGKEIVYGDYSGELSYTGTYTGENHLDDPSVFEDVNQTGQSAKSTFVAEHLNGNQYLNTAAVTACSPNVAVYETLQTIAPTDDGHGNLSGGKPVASTDASTGLAQVDLTIYLEGWDHSVIDTEIGHSFNLGLTFQINRV